MDCCLQTKMFVTRGAPCESHLAAVNFSSVINCAHCSVHLQLSLVDELQPLGSAGGIWKAKGVPPRPPACFAMFLFLQYKQQCDLS